MVPKQRPTTDCIDYMETWHRKRSVWGEPCKEWFNYNDLVVLWPGSLPHMLKTLRVPRWEDFEFQYSDESMWTGRTEREILQTMPGGEGIDLAPWMRTSDHEWSIDLSQAERAAIAKAQMVLDAAKEPIESESTADAASQTF